MFSPRVTMVGAQLKEMGALPLLARHPPLWVRPPLSIHFEGSCKINKTNGFSFRLHIFVVKLSQVCSSILNWIFLLIFRLKLSNWLHFTLGNVGGCISLSQIAQCLYVLFGLGVESTMVLLYCIKWLFWHFFMLYWDLLTFFRITLSNGTILIKKGENLVEYSTLLHFESLCSINYSRMK